MPTPTRALTVDGQPVDLTDDDAVRLRVDILDVTPRGATHRHKQPLTGHLYYVDEQNGPQHRLLDSFTRTSGEDGVVTHHAITRPTLVAPPVQLEPEALYTLLSHGLRTQLDFDFRDLEYRGYRPLITLDGDWLHGRAHRLWADVAETTTDYAEGATFTLGAVHFEWLAWTGPADARKMRHYHALVRHVEIVRRPSGRLLMRIFTAPDLTTERPV